MSLPSGYSFRIYILDFLRFIFIEIFHLRTKLTIMQISDCRKHYCTELDSKRMVMTYLFVIKLQHFICFVNHECEDWIWLIHCCITMSSIFEGMLESDVSAFVATMFQFWVQFTYLTSKIQSSMIEYSFKCVYSVETSF